MAVNIRNLKQTDIAQCLEIYNYYIESSTATFEEEKLSLNEFSERLKRIAAEFPFFVAEENGKISGYAYLDHYNTRSAYRYTADLSIYLARNAVSRGTGGMLLEAVESAGAKRGIKNIISLVTEENEVSCRFHEKHGFEKMGKLESVGFKFGKWLGVYFYQKQIQTDI